MKKWLLRRIAKWLRSYIPQGNYCYALKSLETHAYTLHVGTCPFWEHKGTQEAYCHYCDLGDDSIVLWDKCKECGIKEPTDD